jgi:hypothetical protein
VDLNADGYPDILSGSYSRTGPVAWMAGLFQVLYGKPDGTFGSAEVLNGTDGKPLIIPANDLDSIGESICTRPFAIDWDGDGKLDLVVGNSSGSFYWFKGEGQGRFRPKPEAITSGGSPLKIEGLHSEPFVVDWDGDGSLDIVSGSREGGVQWAKNLAPKGKPAKFGRFEWLIRPGRGIGSGLAGETQTSEKELTGPIGYTRVWVADVNGDGKLDLLVGDWLTVTSPAPGVTPAQYKEKLAAWQKALAAVNKEWASIPTVEEDKAANRGKLSDSDQAKREAIDHKLQEIHRKRIALVKQRIKFMNVDETGFVWLYLQK